MQKLEKYKTQRLSSFSQLIILNEDGSIEESCDSIFPTAPFKAQPFTEHFPFLESIFDLLIQLKTDGEELKYAKIESPLAELPGVYDFTFSRVILDEKDYILWSIYDYTDLYEDFKQYQQKRNELEIHREMLETRNRKLGRQKDLLTQKNIALQSWDEIRKDYYNKVRLALQSPINALDGLSFILKNVSKENNQDYISALRTSVKHLQDVLKEFEWVSSIDGENQFSEIQKFDPSLVINAVTEKLFSNSANDQFELHLNIEDELPNNLYGNPKHLHQILHQLLLNAQKFHYNSDLDLNVSTALQQDNSWNLNIEILEKMEVNTKAPDANENQEKETTDFTNLVFRLSLVKKLIELEGGEISVKNQEDNDGFMIICSLNYPALAS